MKKDAADMLKILKEGMQSKVEQLEQTNVSNKL